MANMERSPADFRREARDVYALADYPEVDRSIALARL
jgi:hypothetical protein